MVVPLPLPALVIRAVLHKKRFMWSRPLGHQALNDQVSRRSKTALQKVVILSMWQSNSVVWTRLVAAILMARSAVLSELIFLPQVEPGLSCSTMPVSTKPENTGLRSLPDRASPAATLLRTMWLPCNQDKPRINANYKKVPRKFTKKASHPMHH